MAQRMSGGRDVTQEIVGRYKHFKAAQNEAAFDL